MELSQAGRPVQPVTVRYSHAHLTTWTRDQVLPLSLFFSFFLPDYLDQGPGFHFFLWLSALMSSLHQVHGMRWSMLLLLATPFKTVLTHTCWSQHSLHPSFSNVTTEPPQVTVKFLPVHKPTLEEKADPILYAKVRPFSCGLYLKQLTCFQAVQEKMASDLGISATDVQRAEFVKELRKHKWHLSAKQNLRSCEK